MDLSSFNPQQQRAVSGSTKPLLIIAGAGTGKTHTLVGRMNYLISHGADPATLCALTFTNKAARQMKERAQLPPGAGEPFVGTFHSLGAAIARRNAGALHRTPGFVIFDDHDSFALIKKVLKNIGAAKETIAAASVARKISGIKNGEAPLAAYADSSRRADQYVSEAYENYERQLADHNALDFDDLLCKVVDLFKKHPEVLERYRNQYRYVLVDEYQDINGIQYELIKLLVGSSGSITVVGDDQQTIYSWRGSNFEYFLNFENDWPGAATVTLDQNYRSTGTVIEAASALIGHNKKQKPKKLWTGNPRGEKIKIVEAGREEDEAAWIAQEVRRRADGKGASAILYRTNAQSRAIETALIDRGIPYEVFGGLKFYERREIKDLISAVRVIINPSDALSRERLEKAVGKARLREALQKIGPFGESAGSAEGAAAKATAPHEIIRKFIAASGYADYVRRALTNPQEREENMRELLYFASQHAGVEPFLEAVSLLQSTDSVRAARRDAKVQIMTIHMAKGLEFENVFVAGASEGLMPHALSLGEESGIEEERRLMYVAMTRAKKFLAIAFHDIPSRFIFEIPQEYAQFESLLVARGGAVALIDDEERYITLD